MLRAISLVFIILAAQKLPAQTADSAAAARQMQEVEVTGYLSRQPLLHTPASVALVNAGQLQNQAGEALLPAMNMVPGLRMEERSPGSYRLSVRGSLLRSPFGIRNVKIYLDEFPLTDAGGNTYLNLIDSRSLNQIEILKGPDGSLFGANSGGVLLLKLNPETAAKKLAFEATGGSFGLVHQSVSFRQPLTKGNFSLHQGFQRTNGYRDNSAMRRHFFQGSYEWDYRPKSQLKLLGFYSDLAYQTPGGLTLSQFTANPRQARPAAGPNPGAEEQKAGIINQTLFFGAVHKTAFGPRINHFVALFGSATNYRNPFISNYETRAENNLGLRTYLQVSSAAGHLFSWSWTTGFEGQHASQHIRNYANLQGNKGMLQTADELQAGQYFVFSRLAGTGLNKLTAEAALSANFYRFGFAGLPGSPQPYCGKRSLPTEYMPRVAASYRVLPALAWRASASRGYSPPTTAEIRPSGTQINPQLKAESGWNYETGLRYSHYRNRFQADATVFTYRLKKAIVRRVTAQDEEFFTNAGGTNQTGWETSVSGWFIEAKEHGLITGLQVTGSFTYNHFRFAAYQSGDNDFSGNRLTGVPERVTGAGFVLHLRSLFSVSGQWLHTGRLPLNDANTAYADSYELLQVRIAWRKELHNRRHIQIYAGADNLLNQKYSLGNDINAFGNRYYNAAPPRNYFAGLIFAFF